VFDLEGLGRLELFDLVGLLGLVELRKLCLDRAVDPNTAIGDACLLPQSPLGVVCRDRALGRSNQLV
jgi:hypothetical protein